MAFGRRYPKKERDPENDPFDKINVYIPKSLHLILKDISDKIHMPISKLICFSIDNELEVENQFYYPTDLPTSPFVPDAYVDEAGKIYKFLEKMEYGIARDHLLLCRRDMGIHSKSVFLLAYRELFQSGLLEEFYPEKAAFRYQLNYRYVRLKSKRPKSAKERRNEEA